MATKVVWPAGDTLAGFSCNSSQGLAIAFLSDSVTQSSHVYFIMALRPYVKSTMQIMTFKTKEKWYLSEELLLNGFWVFFRIVLLFCRFYLLLIPKAKKLGKRISESMFLQCRNENFWNTPPLRPKKEKKKAWILNSENCFRTFPYKTHLLVFLTSPISVQSDKKCLACFFVNSRDQQTMSSNNLKLLCRRDSGYQQSRAPNRHASVRQTFLAPGQDEFVIKQQFYPHFV